jgi:hypothetical protein
MICFKTNTPFTFAWMVDLNQSNVLLQVYEFTYFISEKLQKLGMNNHNYPIKVLRAGANLSNSMGKLEIKQIVCGN